MPVTRSMTRSITRGLPEPSEPIETAGSASFFKTAEQDLVDRQLWAQIAIMESLTDNRDGGSGSDSEPARTTMGSIPGSKPLAWLFLLLSITAAAISLFFLARWQPLMTSFQHTGPSCSSFDRVQCPALTQFDLERKGQRRDHHREGLRAQMADVGKLGLRLTDIEDRLQHPRSEIEELRSQFTDLDHRVETLLHESKVAAKLAAPHLPIRQVNWLSYDLGARAVTQLSSPSEYFQKSKALPTRRKAGGWSFLGGLLAGRGGIVQEGLSPSAKFDKIDYGLNGALQPWRENEPRYCTAGRKAQLGAKLPRPITPRSLVIEYYRRSEVPAVGAAPKEVELWIPITDDAARSAVVRMITAIHPDILADQRGQEEALDARWVPVGRWKYDVYADEIAQTFHLPVELESLDVVVDEIVLRVNSNWGNKAATCLVRARLHGVDKSGLREQLDGS
ncbi:hypothetical protein MMC07_002256 [Pseudocyphellaria aurata]|nr:hypothetical protein [Pseudocyphellaria aurata]